MRSTRVALAAAVTFAALAAQALAGSFVAEREGSTLEFTFVQAGARASGVFREFDVQLTVDEAAPKRNRLTAVVQVKSLDTRDEERDEVLRGAELFDVARHPQARFESTSIRSLGAGRYEATGKLTIRGVTREARLPFRLAERMEGDLAVSRLAFGVGQGDWRSTEWVGDEVEVRFALRLRPASRPGA